MGEDQSQNASALPKIPSDALVRRGNSEVANALRDVAREAARQWGHDHVNAFVDPANFGKAVAEVYLAALVGINEGFGPDSEHPEGRS